MKLGDMAPAGRSSQYALFREHQYETAADLHRLPAFLSW